MPVKSLFNDINKVKYLRYCLLNFILISLFELALLKMNNGKSSNPYPWLEFVIMLPMSLVIIFLQYPILLLKPSWLFKSFIYYASMLCFLFVYGILFNIAQDTNSIGVMDSLKAGFSMSFLGQIFGGIVVLPIVIVVNWLLENFTMTVKRERQ